MKTLLEKTTKGVALSWIIGACWLVMLIGCATINSVPLANKRKAEKAFQQKNYTAAAAFAQKVLEVDSLDVSALMIKGESAYRLGDRDAAIQQLVKIPEGLRTGKLVRVEYSLGHARLIKGEYVEAAKHYERFLKNGPLDTHLINKANEALSYSKWMLGHLENEKSPIVTHLAQHVNSVYSDFSPLRFADKLYFSSYLSADTIPSPIQRIFSSIQGRPARLIEENTSDPKLHSSHVAFTSDTRQMFYTICEGRPGNERCMLYQRERQYEGHWGSPKRLPRQINLDTFTATQPTVGYDKVLGKEVLYFTSNRNGGKGKKDIWGSVIEKDGTFGEPFNLPFNTAENEVTPFFHQSSQTLFFSSTMDGGFGGYDIYRVQKTKSGWSSHEGLDQPINSRYDDLYYTFHTGSGKAYFASNRPDRFVAENSADDKTTDIYEVDFSVELIFSIFNSRDSSQVGGATLNLLTGGGEFINTIAIPSDKHQASLLVDLEKNYIVEVVHKGYLPTKKQFSTEGIASFTRIDFPLFLRSDTIYENPIPATIDQFPLDLYFDNDKPGYGSWLDLTTPLTYEQAYLGYLNRKQEFVKEYSSGLSGTAKLKAEEEITTFFDKEVEANFVQLQALLTQLITHLQTGKTVEITLSGNASPLASPAYNDRLISRRISSLENYFRRYEGGILEPWINSGDFRLKIIPAGQEVQLDQASNDSSDRRLSEFSPAASKLRKVTIMRIKVQPKPVQGTR